jgi:bacteriochlorophyllide a dehydrogenase
MMTTAVVLQGPERLELRRLTLTPPAAGQVVVDIEWSAISTGTERLLWSGKMPPFPGMGYPLVPGYESVGRVVAVDGVEAVKVGDRVFVPGASCFGDVRGLFGGAASRLVVPAARVTRIDDTLAEEGVLLALAATAEHALVSGDGRPAELIVGHGVLGRLLARLAVAAGGNPVVWETNAARAAGALGYRVVDPKDDPRKDYRAIYDVSGDASLLDTLVGRLGRGGEIVLAGFYDKIQLTFPPAFMKEARLRIAAEFLPADLQSVLARVSSGRLSLGGLITHRRSFDKAAEAYATAFTDPDCLKMLIDWRTCQ